MHYCVHLLTKQLPTEKEIEKIMEPYNWDSIDNEDTDDGEKKIEYPVFTWDWYQIGGRYSACLKPKVDEDDSENREYYNWGYFERNPRNERLFHSALLRELKRNAKVPFAYREESYFLNMGYRDGYILVDGARQKDILNLDELGCFGCVLPDGSAIARESWTGNGFVEDDKFDEKYKKAVADNMDRFLTVLDIHD